MKKISVLIILMFSVLYGFSEGIQVGNNTDQNVTVIVKWRPLFSFMCPSVVTRTACILPFGGATWDDVTDPGIVGFEPYTIIVHPASPTCLTDWFTRSHAHNTFLTVPCPPASDFVPNMITWYSSPAGPFTSWGVKID